jgi:hypothetical protein
VVAVLEEDELAARRGLRLPARRLPRDQAIERAGDEQRRRGEVLEHAVEVERERAPPAVLGVGGAGLVHERLARELGQVVPQLSEAERTADRGYGAHARLERRGARREVPAEADAECTHAREIEVVARRDGVQDAGHRDFVVVPHRQRVAALPLPRPVQRQGGHAPGQEQVLEQEELLLRGVESGDQQHQRRPAGRGWSPEIGDDAGRLDALRGRVEQPVRLAQRRDCAVGRAARQRGVEHPHELGEVEAHRRAQPRLAGRACAAGRLRLAREAGVHLGGLAPCVQPLVPALNPRGGAREVVDVDAGLHEPRPPVLNGCPHARVRHPRPPPRCSSRGPREAPSPRCGPAPR